MQLFWKIFLRLSCDKLPDSSGVRVFPVSARGSRQNRIAALLFDYDGQALKVIP